MKSVLFFLAALFPFYLSAQAHWETILFADDLWHYHIPTNDTPTDWQALNFDDSTWNIGNGGFGYGDGDDQTQLPTGTISAYIRRDFVLYDTETTLQAILNIDYDDGFVAYLNGIEIARANMVGEPPLYNDLADEHEAETYQGGNYAYYVISPTLWQSIALIGNNVLAIEVHNAAPSSSDLSLLPFLSVEINHTSIIYNLPPDWFDAPATLFFTSNLPIVAINTEGQDIMDEPRITCQMGIIWNGDAATNQLSDDFNHYNGTISIEYRGNSSQNFPKLSMGLTTLDNNGNDADTALLDMPAEHDWILYAPYTDKTMMRDALTYELSRQMGWYATRSKYVELFINNEYRGIYLFMEKLKRDNNRVDISKLDSDDNSGDPLTGGYILKTDHFAGNTGEPFYSPSGITIQYEYPRFDAVSDAQKAYIQNYINDFENALYSDQFDDPEQGYRAYTNLYSFIDMILLNELSNNVDGYRLSAYYYKDRDSNCGKLTFSPPWDFNLTYGNADYCDSWRTDIWQLYQGCYDGPAYWFRRMLEDPYFAAVLRCRWFDLRQNALKNSHINTLIDSTATLLSDAIVRDSTRWQTIGNYVWPNYYIPNSYKGETDTLKWWLKQRLQWMDSNMFGLGTSCGATATQTIRISEINYHAADTLDTGDWIELHNYGTNTVNIDYWQLIDKRDLRRYCRISPNTTIAPNSYLVLCTDSAKFISHYPTLANQIRPLCFNLDNGGTQLVLYNAQHRPAFDFTYSDTPPFDTLPDGYGYTLELTSTGAWSASCNIGGTPATTPTTQLHVSASTDSELVCRNNIVTYRADVLPAATYTWSITQGNGIITSGQGTPEVAVLWLGAGIGTVTVIVSTP